MSDGTTSAFTTLVQVEELRRLIAEGTGLLLLDCTFDLGDPHGGKAVYRASHLPGARYLDLERDMSGAASGTNGRHPLPARSAFTATMRGLGLNDGDQVVVYDGNGGIYAARAWWMLRWLGHANVAVLDGGRQAWIDAGWRRTSRHHRARATLRRASRWSGRPSPPRN